MGFVVVREVVLLTIIDVFCFKHGAFFVIQLSLPLGVLVACSTLQVSKR